MRAYRYSPPHQILRERILGKTNLLSVPSKTSPETFSLIFYERTWLPTLAGDLYALHYAAVTERPELKALDARCASWSASVLAYFLFEACLIEFRHFSGNGGARKRSKPIWDTYKSELRKLKSKVPSSRESLRESLRDYMRGLPGYTLPFKGVSKLVYLMDEGLHADWDAGYGGLSWGEGIRTLVSLVEGKISPLVFCDRCFALVHNGGPLFNKSKIGGGPHHLNLTLNLTFFMEAEDLELLSLSSKVRQLLFPKKGG